MNASARLLQDRDPAPFELFNQHSASDTVIVCEHAGQSIPVSLGNLGLPETQIDRHIAYDIGAADLSRIVAEKLGAPLVLQPYSRLVIDCNRPIEAPDSIPEISDEVKVPGNRNLSERDRRLRIDEIFLPFQQAVANILDQFPRRAVFAVHSFTRNLGTELRPWDIAFLFRRDRATSRTLAASVRREAPGWRIGMNRPYSIDDLSDYFVPHHGERRGLAHSLIEVRNDHLTTKDDQRYWAELLCAAITALRTETEQ